MVEARIICQGYDVGEGTVSEMREVFKEMVRDYGGDVTLWVWKPRHNCWVDQKGSYSAVKATWRD